MDFNELQLHSIINNALYLYNEAHIQTSQRYFINKEI